MPYRQKRGLPRIVTTKSKTYISIRQFSRDLTVCRQTVINKMNAGYSADELLSMYKIDDLQSEISRLAINRQ